MNRNVGVVGVGNIGMGIATNLVKAGFNVHVYDIRPDPLAKLKKIGAIPAKNIKELAKNCTLIFSVLLTYKQNLSTFSGPDGLVENLRFGSTIFVCSTISPAEAQNLADIAKAKGIRCLDSPVSGGPEGANEGTLTLMLGGDEKAREEHHTALEAISANIYHFGDVGAGETAKAINNLLVAVNIAAVGEAMILASKSNLDLKKIYKLISNSAGNSYVFKERAVRIIKRDFTTKGALKILLKDTNIINDAARSLKLVLPLTNVANQLYLAGVNNGWGDEDDAAVVKTIEQLSNYIIECSE